MAEVPIGLPSFSGRASVSHHCLRRVALPSSVAQLHASDPNSQSLSHVLS